MIIGIDVGGTNIKSGLMDGENRLILDQSTPTGSTKDEIVNALVSIIDRLKVVAHDEFGEGVSGVGIGIPGIVKNDLNYVFRCPNIGWYNVPLATILRERTGLPVYVDNDATLAALAEYYAGSLQGVDTGILLTLGTGVGGGAIINGRPFRGGNGLGVEAGHIVVGENFYNCNCGKNGCLETFASATAIVRYMDKLIKDGGLNPDYSLSSEEIFKRAERGDALALKAVERFIDYLAKGINNLINIIDPQVVTLGGGVTAAGDFLLDKLIRKVDENLLVEGFPSAKINFASAGNRSGILGAALLALEESSS